ncbi:hypothetical protein M9Y10_033024 [Tritrichomonas musculus]|uniref:Uncharacterized protein n=1 Tax=Tritrichomonas musculus TaxID=1915356 RepID=A0ABR2GXL1_9EUKA
MSKKIPAKSNAPRPPALQKVESTSVISKNQIISKPVNSNANTTQANKKGKPISVEKNSPPKPSSPSLNQSKISLPSSPTGNTAKEKVQTPPSKQLTRSIARELTQSSFTTPTPKNKASASQDTSSTIKTTSPRNNASPSPSSISKPSPSANPLSSKSTSSTQKTKSASSSSSPLKSIASSPASLPQPNQSNQKSDSTARSQQSPISKSSTNTKSSPSPSSNTKTSSNARSSPSPSSTRKSPSPAKVAASPASSSPLLQKPSQSPISPSEKSDTTKTKPLSPSPPPSPLSPSANSFTEQKAKEKLPTEKVASAIQSSLLSPSKKVPTQQNAKVNLPAEKASAAVPASSSPLLPKTEKKSTENQPSEKVAKTGQSASPSSSFENLKLTQISSSDVDISSPDQSSPGHRRRKHRSATKQLERASSTNTIERSSSLPVEAQSDKEMLSSKDSQSTITNQEMSKDDQNALNSDNASVDSPTDAKRSRSRTSRPHRSLSSSSIQVPQKQVEAVSTTPLLDGQNISLNETSSTNNSTENLDPSQAKRRKRRKPKENVFDKLNKFSNQELNAEFEKFFILNDVAIEKLNFYPQTTFSYEFSDIDEMIRRENERIEREEASKDNEINETEIISFEMKNDDEIEYFTNAKCYEKHRNNEIKMRNEYLDDNEFNFDVQEIKNLDKIINELTSNSDSNFSVFSKSGESCDVFDLAEERLKLMEIVSTNKNRNEEYILFQEEQKDNEYLFYLHNKYNEQLENNEIKFSMNSQEGLNEKTSQQIDNVNEREEGEDLIMKLIYNRYSDDLNDDSTNTGELIKQKIISELKKISGRNVNEKELEEEYEVIKSIQNINKELEELINIDPNKVLSISEEKERQTRINELNDERENNFEYLFTLHKRHEEYIETTEEHKDTEYLFYLHHKHNEQQENHDIQFFTTDRSIQLNLIDNENSLLNEDISSKIDNEEDLIMKLIFNASVNNGNNDSASTEEAIKNRIISELKKISGRNVNEKELEEEYEVIRSIQSINKELEELINIDPNKVLSISEEKERQTRINELNDERENNFEYLFTLHKRHEEYIETTEEHKDTEYLFYLHHKHNEQQENHDIQFFTTDRSIQLNLIDNENSLLNEDISSKIDNEEDLIMKLIFNASVNNGNNDSASTEEAIKNRIISELKKISGRNVNEKELEEEYEVIRSIQSINKELEELINIDPNKVLSISEEKERQTRINELNDERENNFEYLFTLHKRHEEYIETTEEHKDTEYLFYLHHKHNEQQENHDIQFFTTDRSIQLNLIDNENSLLNEDITNKIDNEEDLIMKLIFNKATNDDSDETANDEETIKNRIISELKKISGRNVNEKELEEEYEVIKSIQNINKELEELINIDPNKVLSISEEKERQTRINELNDERENNFEYLFTLHKRHEEYIETTEEHKDTEYLFYLHHKHNEQQENHDIQFFTTDRSIQLNLIDNENSLLNEDISSKIDNEEDLIMKLIFNASVNNGNNDSASTEEAIKNRIISELKKISGRNVNEKELEEEYEVIRSIQSINKELEELINIDPNKVLSISEEKERQTRINELNDERENNFEYLFTLHKRHEEYIETTEEHKDTEYLFYLHHKHNEQQENHDIQFFTTDRSIQLNLIDNENSLLNEDITNKIDNEEDLIMKLIFNKATNDDSDETVNDEETIKNRIISELKKISGRNVNEKELEEEYEVIKSIQNINKELEELINIDPNKVLSISEEKERQTRINELNDERENNFEYLFTLHKRHEEYIETTEEHKDTEYLFYLHHKHNEQQENHDIQFFTTDRSIQLNLIDNENSLLNEDISNKIDNEEDLIMKLIFNKVMNDNSDETTNDEEAIRNRIISELKKISGRNVNEKELEEEYEVIRSIQSINKELEELINIDPNKVLSISEEKERQTRINELNDERENNFEYLFTLHKRHEEYIETTEKHKDTEYLFYLHHKHNEQQENHDIQFSFNILSSTQELNKSLRSKEENETEQENEENLIMKLIFDPNNTIPAGFDGINDSASTEEAIKNRIISELKKISGRNVNEKELEEEYEVIRSIQNINKELEELINIDPNKVLSISEEKERQTRINELNDERENNFEYLFTLHKRHEEYIETTEEYKDTEYLFYLHHKHNEQQENHDIQFFTTDRSIQLNLIDNENSLLNEDITNKIDNEEDLIMKLKFNASVNNGNNDSASTEEAIKNRIISELKKISGRNVNEKELEEEYEVIRSIQNINKELEELINIDPNKVLSISEEKERQTRINELNDERENNFEYLFTLHKRHEEYIETTEEHKDTEYLFYLHSRYSERRDDSLSTSQNGSIFQSHFTSGKPSMSSIVDMLYQPTSPSESQKEEKEVPNKADASEEDSDEILLSQLIQMKTRSVNLHSQKQEDEFNDEDEETVKNQVLQLLKRLSTFNESESSILEQYERIRSIQSINNEIDRLLNLDPSEIKDVRMEKERQEMIQILTDERESIVELLDLRLKRSEESLAVSESSKQVNRCETFENLEEERRENSELILNAERKFLKKQRKFEKMQNEAEMKDNEHLFLKSARQVELRQYEQEIIDEKTTLDELKEEEERTIEEEVIRCEKRQFQKAYIETKKTVIRRSLLFICDTAPNAEKPLKNRQDISNQILLDFVSTYPLFSRERKDDDDEQERINYYKKLLPKKLRMKFDRNRQITFKKLDDDGFQYFVDPKEFENDNYDGGYDSNSRELALSDGYMAILDIGDPRPQLFDPTALRYEIEHDDRWQNSMNYEMCSLGRSLYEFYTRNVEIEDFVEKIVIETCLIVRQLFDNIDEKDTNNLSYFYANFHFLVYLVETSDDEFPFVHYLDVLKKFLQELYCLLIEKIKNSIKDDFLNCVTKGLKSTESEIAVTNVVQCQCSIANPIMSFCWTSAVNAIDCEVSNYLADNKGIKDTKTLEKSVESLQVMQRILSINLPYSMQAYNLIKRYNEIIKENTPFEAAAPNLPPEFIVRLIFSGKWKSLIPYEVSDDRIVNFADFLKLDIDQSLNYVMKFDLNQPPPLSIWKSKDKK